jgi:hypothetical protein
VAHEVEVDRRDRAARRGGQRVAVAGGAVQPGPRLAVLEQPAAEPPGAARHKRAEAQRAGEPEAREQLHGPAERREAAEHRRPDGGEGVEQRRDERAPLLAVAGAPAVEARGGPVDVAVERDRAAVGQRVGRAGGGVDPREAVAVERHPCEHGRRGRGGIDGRERVVLEARQRELLGAYRAARPVGRLEDRDRVPGLGQADRGGEPVRAAADDHGVAAHEATRRASWCSSDSRSTLPSPQNECWASRPATR